MDKWQTATVTKIIDQTPSFRTLVLAPENFSNFYSGNFVEVGVIESAISLNKSYSVISSPKDNSKTIEIGVKLYPNGELSPKLFKLKEGDHVLIRGPMGAGFIWEKSDHTTIMIAGGSGICPMVSILRQYDPKKGALNLLFSTRADSIYYKDELEKLCKEKNVSYILRTSTNEGRVNKKYLVEQFGKMIGHQTDFFIAGPTDFVQDISFWLRELGVDETNLKTDDFGAD